jgi:hypothetical protein
LLWLEAAVAVVLDTLVVIKRKMKQRLILPFLFALVSCSIPTQDKAIVNGCDITAGEWLRSPRVNKSDTLIILTRKSEGDTLLMDVTEYQFQPDGTLFITPHTRCSTGKLFFSNCRWTCKGSVLSMHEEVKSLFDWREQSFEVDCKYQIIALDSNRIQLSTKEETVHHIKYTDY